MSGGTLQEMQQKAQDTQQASRREGGVVRPTGKLSQPTDVFSLSNIARMRGFGPGTKTTGAEILGFDPGISKAFDPTNVPTQDTGALTRKFAELVNVGGQERMPAKSDLSTAQPTTTKRLVK